MTTPTAAKKTTPAKATPAKSEETVEETKSRIPDLLNANPILAEFCKRYLEVFDEISKYNKDVLAEKDSEWNAVKVMEQARKFASPENAEDQDKEIKDALDELEKAESARLLARKNVLDKTAKKLGITLSATTERNPETEAPLKEKRKIAVEIGSQLSTIAGLTSDANASKAVTEFLDANPLPAVGRDQTRSFGTGDGKATPKYRVKIEILKDGETILSEDGFTKTALALTKPVFGYERGKAPKSDDLRKAWENAGNTPENTVKTPVEFDDNGLHYVITKK